jgi:hypothetical protein
MRKTTVLGGESEWRGRSERETRGWEARDDWSKRTVEDGRHGSKGRVVGGTEGGMSGWGVCGGGVCVCGGAMCAYLDGPAEAFVGLGVSEVLHLDNSRSARSHAVGRRYLNLTKYGVEQRRLASSRRANRNYAALWRLARHGAYCKHGTPAPWVLQCIAKATQQVEFVLFGWGFA